MREIKFRGKRPDNQQWVYGNYQAGIKVHPHTISWWTPCQHEGNVFDETDVAVVDPETVGQYTGLKDRNGKEAYHKDIVEHEGSLYVVEWDEFDTGFYLAYHKELDNPESEEHLRGQCIIVGVILGNTYDNPELLGEVRE